jgi:hypothetical protein
VLHVLDWLAEPHPERSVVSPFQSNWYCTECPRFEEAPPVVNVYDTPVVPLEDPVGTLGTEIVSPTAEKLAVTLFGSSMVIDVGFVLCVRPPDQFEKL